MLSNICDFDFCTGCKACADKCPMNCIQFIENEGGFVYPVIDSDNCIECGCCRTVCPTLNRPLRQSIDYYMAWHKDEDVLMRSSSGGVFSALSSIVLEEVGVIIGASMDKKTLIVTPNVSEAEKLSGMKIESVEDAKESAYKIGEYCNVMITGGHLNGTNIIYNKEKDELSTLHQDLIKSENLHGTGCSLSAAICANLVLLNNNDKNSKDEDNLKIAIKKSTKFIYESVKNGRYGTLNPNFNSKVL